jgi:uncharacterized damage-inducible protein DinB
MTDRNIEVWMRGPVPGFEPYVQPIAQALLQVKEDVNALAASLPETHVWTRPGGAASIGFHILHIGGSLDRLLTYARGERLTSSQLDALRSETVSTHASLRELVDVMNAQIERALDQLRGTPSEALLAARQVGRAGHPSTVLGLLFHAAEHATRHVGQAITTAKILSATK